MLSFNPGPGQLHPAIASLMVQAAESGLLSRSHRSEAFRELYARTHQLFQEKLEMPSDYTLIFLSSATEAWQIITEGATASGSLHLYSGDFGQRWYDYARYIRPETVGIRFSPGQALNSLDLKAHTQLDLLCVTQNETANGSQIPSEEIAWLNAQTPDMLLAVDATSSMAGIGLTLAGADIWFASVQKCFGLPAGLGILLLGPRAKSRIRELGANGRYNSLVRLLQQAENWQTSYTPNMLGIYLLAGVLAQRPSITEVHQRISHRAERYYRMLEGHPSLKPLIGHNESRSRTVVAIDCGNSATVESLKNWCLGAGLALGNGYGEWKAHTLRIANFPAHSAEAVESLLRQLQQWRPS